MLFLQEIHNISQQSISTIEKERNLKCFISPGTQRGRGAMIIVNTSVIKNSQEIARDQEGNYLVIEGEINGMKRIFINIYAPNRIKSRRELFEKCNDFVRTNRDTYIGGDFNCIENLYLDSLNKNTNYFMERKSDRERLAELREQMGFVDTYRHIHPNTQVFTYVSPTNYKARLDRFYTHHTLVPALTKCEIHPISYSDHDLFLIEIKSIDDHIRWGPGTYKYNKTILDKKENLTEIKRVWVEWRRFMFKHDNLLTWWDAGKRMIVRNNLIPMGKEMKKKEITEKANIEKQLLEEHARTSNNAATIVELKERLRVTEEKEMLGAAIRSRTEWQQKGEKPTKYFCNLENQ